MGVDEVRNWFAGEEVAELYDRARPYHHERTLGHAFKLIDVERSIPALDVGCGTGHSTIGLAAFVDSAIGIDPVEALLRVARRDRRARFVGASAEYLPFRASTFGGITVSAAVHWFNQERFFGEAERVLLPGGWLVVYDHFFAARMRDNPAFEEWMSEFYGKRYPPPPRRPSVAWEEVELPGFVFVGRGDYEDPISMGHEAFVSYLLTHSNTISAVETGRETRSDIQALLTKESRRFFEPEGEPKTMMFRGAFSCLRRGD